MIDMKGQAFSTMKILMGAVFAVAMLAIVYYIIASYSPPITGIEILGDMIKQANNAPEKCFFRERLDFNKGDSISSVSFSPFNVNFHSNSPLISCSSSSCTISDKVSVPVAIKCDTMSKCYVYFASSTCS